MILRLGRFLLFKENARVEYLLCALSYQPLNVSVRELCGIALGFRWYRLHSELVYFSVRERREHYRKSEFAKEGRPERIVLVHIEHPRYSYNTARCALGIKRLVAEYTLQLIREHIGR